MKKTTAALTALVLAVGGVAVTSTVAEAHTPSISATCTGLVLNATAYDGTKKNIVTYTINGVIATENFGATYSKTIAFPQEGKTSTYSATIKAFDGGYNQSKSGSVGPCGTPPPVIPPQPPAKSVPGSSEDAPTCDARTVTIKNWRDDYTYAYDKPSNKWIETVTRVNLPDTSRAASEQECPTPVPTPTPTPTTPVHQDTPAPPAPPAAELAATGTREDVLTGIGIGGTLALVLGLIIIIRRIRRATN